MEKELRLALVCQGGVSLVVYMHGVTKELWKLLRASQARLDPATEASGDTEPVWAAILDRLAAHVDLRVLCDIITGASAGGINGIVLGTAIVEGLDLEPLTDMWLDKADVDRLLDPDARPGSRLIRFYKEPVAWFATHRSEALAGARSDPGTHEAMEKLARFVRSRWFKPPFSGAVFTAMLDEALVEMRGRPRGPALIPATLPFDLAVTVTDYHGSRGEIPIHSPPLVTETEHRRVLSFRSRASMGLDGLARRPEPCPPRELGSRASLVFAARATASFPGAFPPAALAEIDAHLAAVGADWPDRERFVATQLAGSLPPEDVLLIDGSVLDNAPFGPALEAVRNRTAYRAVDRRFVYIDPTPGFQFLDPATRPGKAARRQPGFITAILRALAQIPREQPIRDNLEAIARMSAEIRRARQVVKGMTPAVQDAVGRAVGLRFLLLPPTPERLEKARGQILALAAREAGFAFAAYAQLRLALVLEDSGALLARLAGTDAQGARRITAGLRAAAEAEGMLALGRGDSRDLETRPAARLLARLDTGFRLRRLRFIIRELNEAIGSLDGEARRAAEALKAALYTAASPYIELRRTDELAPTLGRLAQAVAAAPDDRAQAAAALEGLAQALALDARDRAADAALLAGMQGEKLPRRLRRQVLRDWLGFPFYDTVLLPLIGDQGFGSLDEINVDRISPDDAATLGQGGEGGVLKGWQLGAFGAFFSRAWRENDYLWGRLNAADRLVDILLSTLPAGAAAGMEAHAWKGRLFAAILAAEAPRLTRIGPLLETLKGEVEAWNRTP